MAPNVALITGATGISGLALAEYLYTLGHDEWSRVILVSRQAASLTYKDPRAQGLSLDLTQDANTIRKKLDNFGVKDVTHFFSFHYIHEVDSDGQINPYANIPLFQQTLTAVDAACPNLQRVLLQLGAKYYGLHLKPIPGTIAESMGRYDASVGKEIFYYQQEDFMIDLAKQRSWTWNVTVPFYIYGPSYNTTGMSFGTSAAIFFTVVKYLDMTVSFPGCKALYQGQHDLTSTRSIAEFTEYICTHDQCANERFNIVDGDRVTVQELWESMCLYFGVRTHTDFDTHQPWKVEDFMSDKEPVYAAACEKYGGNRESFGWATWQFFDTFFLQTSARVVSMEKAKEVGWTRTYDSRKELNRLFDRMRQEKSLPTIP